MRIPDPIVASSNTTYAQQAPAQQKRYPATKRGSGPGSGSGISTLSGSDPRLVAPRVLVPPILLPVGTKHRRIIIPTPSDTRSATPPILPRRNLGTPPRENNQRPHKHPDSDSFRSSIPVQRGGGGSQPPRRPRGTRPDDSVSQKASRRGGCHSPG